MKPIVQFFSVAMIILGTVSCSKTATEKVMPAMAIDSNASYKIIITGTWRKPQHTVPAGDHFTPFIGMIHGKESSIFKTGTVATIGVKNVAEVGYGITLQNEIDTYISAGKALSRFQISLPTIVSTDSTVINFSSRQSLISFASMIAPSPDWFVGLESFNLIKDGNWQTDVTVNAPGYDAGTEDGNVFGYSNPATMPQQNVSYLTPANASIIANGNSVIAPFATVRFVRQK